MVSAKVYDNYGRESSIYLPFVANNAENNFSINDGNFKLNPFYQQAAFMQQAYGNQGDAFFYSRVDYEASPLNRVEKTMNQGNSWVGSGKGHEMKYWTNTGVDAIRIWNVTNSISDLGDYTSPGVYSGGTLFKNVTVGEHGKQLIEFKDKEGKIILKKLQLTAAADNGSGNGHADWLCTYYLYDDLGLLRCVIQPEAVRLMTNAGNWVLSSAILNGYCFRYKYDDRNRMVAKKVPDVGEVYLVYDKRDRLVFTQDANMRITNKWLSTLYDAFNRSVLTGMITYTGTRQDLQTYVDQNTGSGSTANITAVAPITTNLIIDARKIARPTYQGTQSVTFLAEFTSEAGSEFVASVDANAPGTSENISITDNPLPAGSNLIPLTITYYDTYSWTTKTYNNSYAEKLTAGNNPYAESLAVTTATKGLVTGTKVRVMENPGNLVAGSLLSTVNFYDEKGRVIQTQAESNANAIDIHSNLYDFSGKLLSSFIAHNNPEGNSHPGIGSNLEYDQLGRLLTVKKMIYTLAGDASPAISKIILQNSYDELGQLKRKTLAPEYNSNQGLETQDFDYNIRGWLLGVNRAYARDDNNSNYFGFDLGYDKTNNNLIAGQQYAAAQYNGNIAGTVWKSKGDQEKRKYDFTYNAVNRLTTAGFNQYTSSSFNKTAGLDFSVSNLTYDANGNILTMNQMGWKPGGSSEIDKLQYTYIANSNKLLNVKDVNNLATTTLGDFRTSALHPQASAKQSAATPAALAAITDYGYDVNGNLITDLNKDIGNATTNGIVYNYLNLPWQVSFKNAAGDKGTITYIYDASGNKVNKITVENASAADDNTAKTTTTDYIAGFVYENNVLQFAGHEEGRVQPIALTPGVQKVLPLIIL